MVAGHAAATCPPYKTGSSPYEIIVRHAPRPGPPTPEQFTELIKKGIFPALLVMPSSGLAPLTVKIDWWGDPVENPARVEFDVDGDGQPEWSQPQFESAPEKQHYTYQREGRFQFTVRVYDSAGKMTTYSAQITVFSPAALDADLRARWSGLKAALRQGNVPAALECIHSEARGKYKPAFEALAKSGKPIDRTLTDIRLVETGPGGAEYEMLRDREGRVLSYPVWFLIDWDGVWRLNRF